MEGRRGRGEPHFTRISHFSEQDGRPETFLFVISSLHQNLLPDNFSHQPITNIRYVRHISGWNKCWKIQHHFQICNKLSDFSTNLTWEYGIFDSIFWSLAVTGRCQESFILHLSSDAKQSIQQEIISSSIFFKILSGLIAIIRSWKRVMINRDELWMI